MLKFYEKFDMQNNTYDDDAVCHFTFLVGEYGEGEQVDTVWADVSGYINEDGTAEVYFDDGYNGYILDEHRNETLIALPDEIAAKKHYGETPFEYRIESLADDSVKTGFVNWKGKSK